MNPFLSAGIIGAGRIASRLEKDPLRPKPCTHAGAYFQNPNTQLVSAADPSETNLQECGVDWNLKPEALFSNYEEMLRHQSLDLVSICAYAPQRLEMCQAALESGAKGLWIEKALGCSLAEGIEIVRLIKEHNSKAVVDYPRRCYTPYRAIKQAIEDNTFGRLQSVTCHMTHQLIHTGSHAFDILRYWCGEAVQVTGTLEEGLEDSKAVKDQGGHAEIQFENGTIAFISAYRKKYYIFQFDLIFENARILLGNDIQKVYLPGESKHYQGFKELFEQTDYRFKSAPHPGILQDLVNAVRENTPVTCSAHNAIEALKIGLTIFQSHQEGNRPLHPNNVDPNFTVESV